MNSSHCETLAEGDFLYHMRYSAAISIVIRIENCGSSDKCVPVHEVHGLKLKKIQKLATSAKKHDLRDMRDVHDKKIDVSKRNWLLSALFFSFEF